MANRMPLLEERLRRVETRTRSILDAAVQHVKLQATTEVWRPHLVAFFGTEAALFETVGIDRDVFDDALALTAETVQERRGKLGALRTNREKLLFLVIFEKGNRRPRAPRRELHQNEGTHRREGQENRAAFYSNLSAEPSAYSGNPRLKHPMQLSLWTAPCAKYDGPKNHSTRPKCFLAGSTLCMV